MPHFIELASSQARGTLTPPVFPCGRDRLRSRPLGQRLLFHHVLVPGTIQCVKCVWYALKVVIFPAATPLPSSIKRVSPVKTGCAGGKVSKTLFLRLHLPPQHPLFLSLHTACIDYCNKLHTSASASICPHKEHATTVAHTTTTITITIITTIIVHHICMNPHPRERIRCLSYDSVCMDSTHTANHVR